MDPGGEIGGTDLVELLAEMEARVALELVAFGAEFADLLAGQFEIDAEAEPSPRSWTPGDWDMRFQRK
ncbi:hypothetical protein PV396_43890 [Streptomyces sp. ME02-8801-2C]|uniref:hypothetical protein n=1 Tax=Streptomyces sp. ME02-8801-2C TaxID=3028680 RepID=UPI0029AE27AA|nr:hypothetical protein [Streptomyces sp. ME02-8801-2C]MDX3458787.1 hypothetical protein [Streptomyces sp. ME02-8801-2C]